MISLALLLKLSLFAVSVTFGAFTARRVRAQQRARLASVDSGSICLRCDGHDVSRDGERVECRACGYATTLSHLRSMGQPTKELDMLADGRRAETVAQATKSLFL